ncbi:MAG: hypothetical protein BGO14_08505 [Chlamydiales bacterium 38-26]|nr:glycosyltransferase family 2 protein [Chlamydiales bacterium]OJV11029.1 MAG: hypothetical protein BGO14_08505 [Chlamydiales bacterium 38-26]
MSQQPRIDILLATCNGEKYLADQLDSLLKQEYQNIRLIVRDDASQDQTPSILKSYQTAYPEKITVHEGKEKLGVKGNFSKLMEFSAAPYVMFADQDDVWLPHKVKQTLNVMQQLERKYGEQPLLVHSDLVVVDENLRVLNRSFWKYAGIKPHAGTNLNRLLSQNVVTGCTVMVNRLLIEIAKPIPVEAFMHDWWIALTAASFGQIGCINVPTLYYRQHSKNTLGAQKFGSWANLMHSAQKLMQRDVRKFQQASTFFHRYFELLDPDHRTLTKEFLKLQRESWVRRRYLICKHGFFKQGFLRNFAEFILG